MNYQGIVVLGAPRSGTTLMRRLLDAHPDIHCPPETNLLRACARFLREEPMSSGVAVGPITGLAFSAIGESRVLDGLRHFAFSIFRELADTAQKPLWAEKTAFDAFYVDEIERLCGEHCRFICVFRHGLDVAVSVRDLCDKMGMYPSELHEYIRRFQWPLEAFATAWVDISTRLDRFVKKRPDACLAVRYEDLVADPAAQMTRIFEFLETPTDVERLLGAAAGPGGTPGLGDWKTYQTSGISNQSVARWRSLPRDLLARLAPIVNPTLEQVGYEPVAAPSQLTGEAARRALQLSLLAGRLTKDDSKTSQS